jgi:D-sedoheptulose 7-phosphate isomerase
MPTAHLDNMSVQLNQAEFVPRDPKDLILSVVHDSLGVKLNYFSQHADDVVRAASMIAAAFRNSKKILLCGNGGSSTDAQHIAGEFVNQFAINNRRALPALALSTDGGVLTAIANDSDFENIFARQIQAFGAPGDVLVAITTSGTSPNIVAAVEQARRQKLKIIGFLGRDGGSVALHCDLPLIVSSSDTQRIQETHNLLGHVICQLVEQELFADLVTGVSA